MPSDVLVPLGHTDMSGSDVAKARITLARILWLAWLSFGVDRIGRSTYPCVHRFMISSSTVWALVLIRHEVP